MNVLLNMPSQSRDQPSGIGRLGLEISHQLLKRSLHHYSLRSKFRITDLDDDFRSMRNVVTIGKVRPYAMDIVQSSLTAAFNSTFRSNDLIVNMDPLGAFAGGRARITIVHDLYFATMPTLYSRFGVIKAWLIHYVVLSRSIRIVTISQSTANDIKRHFPHLADRVRVILANSPMRAAPDPAWLGEWTNRRFVLAVANVTPNKNLETLGEAFCRVAAKYPDLLLVHVGSDAADRLAGVMAKHGFGDRLVRQRGIADSALAALYQSARCLVTPSLYEGFCLPLLEAQRYGCPVLFANAPGTAEIGGIGGLRFDPLDVSALARLLDRVIDKPTLRSVMRARGYRNATRFSWERAAAEYEAVFAEALSEMRVGRR
jgi:glycosyltransferase involved in cell wall biosynthesis